MDILVQSFQLQNRVTFVKIRNINVKGLRSLVIVKSIL